MRKIVLMMSVSVDGFMEGPDRELDWHMVDEELHRHFNEELAVMGAFLDGRVTYELMAGFWPTADSDPRVPSRWSNLPASGGTCPRSCTPGPWSGPTGTPLSFEMSSSMRSSRSRQPRVGTWCSAGGAPVLSRSRPRPSPPRGTMQVPRRDLGPPLERQPAPLPKNDLPLVFRASGTRNPRRGRPARPDRGRPGPCRGSVLRRPARLTPRGRQGGSPSPHHSRPTS